MVIASKKKISPPVTPACAPATPQSSQTRPHAAKASAPAEPIAKEPFTAPKATKNYSLLDENGFMTLNRTLKMPVTSPENSPKTS